MEILTLAIVVIVIGIVLVASPWVGFLAYLAVLLYYPHYLRLIVMGLTLSAGRMIVCFLLVRYLLDDGLRRRFRWRTLDTAIVACVFVYFLVSAIGGVDPLGLLKFQAGMLLDTLPAYFCARLLFTEPLHYTRFARAACIMMIPLAFLVIYESATGNTPYTALLQYRFRPELWLGAEKFAGVERMHGSTQRMGFYRAQGPHSHPILLGLTFVLFLPLSWQVLTYSEWRRWRVWAAVMLSVGTFFSMSSGPMVAWVAGMGQFWLVRMRRYFKTLLVLFALLCVFLEFYTDRPHFYHVLSARIGFDPGTSYVRARLLDVALERLPEYWLLGYGGRDPGWGREVSGLGYTDPCVQYVALAIMYGLPGLCAYLVVIAIAFGSLVKAANRCRDRVTRAVLWGLFGSLVVYQAGQLSIAPFGVLPALEQVFLGMAGSAVGIAAVMGPSYVRDQGGVKDDWSSGCSVATKRREDLGV